MMKTITKIKVFMLALGIFIGFANSANAGNGKEIFINNCRVCHGENLHGDMPGVPDLSINRAWTMKLDSQIHKFVKEGTEASGKVISMPAKGGNPNLTDSEIKSAVQYMRKIIKKSPLK